MKTTKTAKTAKKTNTKKAIAPTEQLEINIVDVILTDHVYLKECIRTLKSEDADSRDKLKYAKGFLDALAHHSKAEKIALYAPLKKISDVHFDILEGEIEHGIVDAKVKMLTPKIAKAKASVFKEQLGAEMKVLAELVEHHIKEEESELLPKIKNDVDEKILFKLGAQFVKLRQFTEQNLRESPKLQIELMGWKESVKDISSQFVTKMDKYIESLKP